MQEEIIMSVIEGKDVLAILPTGGGKSVCYQLPALAMQGMGLVVSPLIALMQDQVLRLTEKGIAAACIYSGMSRQQVQAILHGAQRNEYQLLYVSPERLQTSIFQEYAVDFDLNLIAVDEAHCISQWGHDFRPAYRNIGALRNLFPAVPMMALTASANEVVQQDIREQLALKQPALFRQSVVRDNLFYHVRYTENKPGATVQLFQHRPSGSGILYCRTRKRCVDAALLLNQEGVATGVYHAGMEREERETVQKAWMENHHRVMSATTAFGMGIDKPDVRIVAHYDAPQNIEEYYQESGRAGRDGQKAHAVLFYNHNDLLRLEASTELNYPPEAYIRQVYQAVGDFLQLPAGSGMEAFFAFDVLRFCHNFKLDVLPTFSAIRILEREGLWQWNEDTQTKTLVQFTTDRNTLTYLEQQEPRLAHIATGLLRLYAGIFHFPAAIDEFELSKMLRMDNVSLDAGLNQLCRLGVVRYQPALRGSTLYWMHHRVAAGDLVLDTRHINRLRQAHEERVRQMMAYIQDVTTCRNILLSRYFGENVTKACGHCDVCQRKVPEQPSAGQLMVDLLQKIRTSRQITITELSSQFPGIEQSKIIEYIRLLSEEHLCRIDPTGIIFAT